MEMPNVRAATVRASLCYWQQAIGREAALHVREADDLMTKIIDACRNYEGVPISETNQQGVE